MADLGHELTEEELKALELRMREEYRQAATDAQKKLEDYMREFDAGRREQKALLDAGKITQQDFSNWVYRHTMMGKRWEELRDVLAEDFHRANEAALAMARGEMPNLFALNANYATYQLEHDGQIDTAFTLYNADTAEYLLREQRQLMPGPSSKKAAEIAANKDRQWNAKKIQSAVLQGVLQGEDPYEVAQRLMKVGQMNYNDAVRYARTMGTSAQNAGRYEGYNRAARLGVDLMLEWQATLDGRTRHDHRLMHGKRKKVNEPFVLPDGHKIRYPADCSGDSYAIQGEIWNCRCTLLSWVAGFEGDTVKSSPKMGKMTFEEWQVAKKPKEKNVASNATSKQTIPFTLTLGKQYTMADLTMRTVKGFEFSDGTAYGVRKKADAIVYTTPDGVEFVFPKKYNTKHQTLTIEQLLEAYNKVPEQIRSRGQRRIIVHDVYNPQDAYWRKTYKNFTHSYATGGDTLNYWRWDYPHDVDFLGIKSLPHEMGHFIDWQGKYLTGTRFSLSTEWAEAMQLDFGSSGKASPTKYGENSPSEDFAESLYKLVEDAQLFEKTFPHRYALLVKLLT